MVEEITTKTSEFRKELKTYLELAEEENCIIELNHYNDTKGYYIPKEIFQKIRGEQNV